jgi:hypothetical protein
LLEVVEDIDVRSEQKQTNTHEWDAFPPCVDRLRSLTEAFPGHVALVHGDSHFGARNTHWVSATIDPDNPSFSPSNRESFPAIRSNVDVWMGRASAATARAASARGEV